MIVPLLVALAAAQARADLPLIAKARHATESNVITVNCQPGRARGLAVCTLAEVLLIRKGEVCTVELLPPSEIEFEQLDADTWRSVSTGGVCNVTTIQTLWRQDGYWSYRQVTSTPPSKNGICKAIGDRTMDFSPRPTPPRPLGCRFFD